MRRPALMISIVLGASLVLLFQNCAKMPLEKAIPSVAPFAVKGEMELCIDDPANYTVENFLIANLNMTPNRGVISEDSDADGIADVEEIALGFDPYKRRTNGKILDGLCLDLSGSSRCLEQVPVGCNTNSQIMGLNDCDIKTMRLDSLYDHPTQGLDSDKDGIVDLLEILFGTLPNRHDSNDDPDHDGVVNGLEIQQGTNPSFSNTNIAPADLIDYKVTKGEDSPDCNGEVWNVTVNRLPLAGVKAYLDPLDRENSLSPLLSHEDNENVIAVFVKLKPQTGYIGNNKIYFKDFKINRSVQEFKYYLKDFKAAGEVLP